MGSRILITTFGFDEDKILSAMRMLAYDKLVLVTGKDSLEKDGYKRIVEIESGGKNGIETILVNVFSFMVCLKKIEETIDKYTKKGYEVLLNVSGGTKVLSDAAMFAAFQKGIKSFHCEEECIELPVILGLGMKERLSEMQIDVLNRIEGKVENKDFENMLVGEGHSLASVQKAIRELKSAGILGIDLDRKKILLFVNESHRYLQDRLAE